MKFRRRNAQKAAEYLSDAAAEASFYQEAAAELATGMRIEGLWVQALAENEMNDARAAGAYIQKRVEIMKAETALRAFEIEEAEKERTANLDDIARRKEQMKKNFTAD